MCRDWQSEPGHQEKGRVLYQLNAYHPLNLCPVKNAETGNRDWDIRIKVVCSTRWMGTTRSTSAR